MKKLLNTLYITSKNSYLSLDGENIVILLDDKEAGRVPLHNLEGIVTFGFKGVSPALMGKCAEYSIPLNFLSMNGRFLAGVTGPQKGNIHLRKTQYRISESPEQSLDIAKSFITGKLYNSRWVLERAARDYPLRLDSQKLKNISQNIKNSISKINDCDNIDSLRGIEGEAATRYFSVFDDLILQQKEDFYYKNRNKRPPLDNINAMLSYVYTLLRLMYVSALETVGLDPYVGFMHTDRPGRESLALDMMEELRSVYADRFVLSLVNKKIVSPKGFVKKENGAVIMSDETRQALLHTWQEKKYEVIRHPFLEEKIEWGLVPYVQALLLSRTLRGDLDAYPPFLWK